MMTKKLYRTDDLRIKEIKELSPPEVIRNEFPVSERASEITYEARQEIHRILHGADNRLLVIIRWLSFPSLHSSGFSYDVGARYGIFVALLAGIAEVTAAVMAMRASGEQVP